MNKNNLIQSSLISASLTIIFVTILTIAGELYKVTGADGKVINPIKDFLKMLHGHHWVGKSIWAIVFFIIATAVFYFVERNVEGDRKLGRYVTALTCALGTCTLILYAFTTYEFLVH